MSVSGKCLCYPLNFLEVTLVKRRLKYLHPSVYLSRLFRELRVLIPFILFSVLLLNLFLPRTHFDTAKVTLLQNPSHLPSLLLLVDQLMVNNQLPAAESLVNQYSSPLDSNPGLSLRRQDLARLKLAPILLEEETRRFQTLVIHYPSYRDGYLKLAILNLKLNRPFLAQKNLSLARAIDPNFPLVQKLQAALSN